MMEYLKVHDVRSYGAVGDNVQKDTKAIQAAIDACSEQGGGIVYFPAGRYISGTLILKSNITLHLAGNAFLLGSQDIMDYTEGLIRVLEEPQFSKCFLYAEKAHNIVIEGQGCIDGQGAEEILKSCEKNGKGKERPQLIRLVDCQQITFRGITLKDSSSWNTVLVGCRYVNFDGIRIHCRVFANEDGIDLTGCQDVMIANCIIDSRDDAICLKTYPGLPCGNITITNCIVTSATSAIKFGTASAEDFRNITISNCAFYNCQLGAIKLLAVDGGALENVIISNIVMENVEGPIFIRLGKRNRRYDTVVEQVFDNPLPDEGLGEAGVLRNVSFSNIRAEVSSPSRKKWGVMITGIPGALISDLSFKDIHLSFPGGGSLEEAAIVVPEDEARYPEQYFFGVLPSYGIYLRHATGIQWSGLSMTVRNEDMRFAIYCEDVTNTVFDDVYFSSEENNNQSLIKLADSTEITFSRCRVKANADRLITLDGSANHDIVVRDSDLRKIGQISTTDDVSVSTILSHNNLV